MGMFDYIRCEAPLPLKKTTKAVLPKDWQSKEDFQTKDLDNTLSVYKISKTGQLSYEKVESEMIRVMTEKEEAKLRKKKSFVWPYEQKVLSRKWVKEPFTGMVEFYASPYDTDGNEWWLEYNASFVNGKLKGKIKTVREEIMFTKDQIETRELEWQQTLQKHENHPWTKIRRSVEKYTYGYYGYGVRQLAKGIGKINDKLAEVRWWISRTL
jgi:hypothetical protein